MSYVIDWNPYSGVPTSSGNLVPFVPMAIGRGNILGMAVKNPKPRIWLEHGIWWCQTKGAWSCGYGARPVDAFVNYRLSRTPRNG